MKKNILITALSLVLISNCLLISAQSRMPEIMDTGSINEQMDYLQQKTLIYNDFRAIREDIFQKMKTNTIDSVVALKNEIGKLNNSITMLENKTDSLALVLSNTRNELNTAIKNRDSLLFFGAAMSKTLYNTIMWTFLAGLLSITVLVLISFNRNRILTKQTKKEFEEMKEEFENYRKMNREKIEQMVINHFNEIKKIKGER